jgi:short-subunit dehydrogenase
MEDRVMLGLHARYGGYALVTGAARGIGRAFATRLAADGFGLLLVDREADETVSLAAELSAQYGVDAHPLPCDLAAPGLEEKAQGWARDYEIGILVNNAGVSTLGSFFEIPLDAHLATLDINCRATLVLTHVIGRVMASRGRGGIIIISSASGMSGSPYFCHYAATKGYGLNLAAGLWSELRGSGVDALAVCPGLTNTRAVQDQQLDEDLPFYIPIGGPDPVALGALRALGTTPVRVPTFTDRVSAGVLAKLLPRSWTLSILKRSIGRMHRVDSRDPS